MPRVNAHVQNEIAHLRDEWDRGAVEGYEAAPSKWPEFIAVLFRTTLPYWRGFLLGVLLRERERMDG